MTDDQAAILERVLRLKEENMRLRADEWLRHAASELAGLRLSAATVEEIIRRHRDGVV